MTKSFTIPVFDVDVLLVTDMEWDDYRALLKKRFGWVGDDTPLAGEASRFTTKNGEETLVIYLSETSHRLEHQKLLVHECSHAAFRAMEVCSMKQGPETEETRAYLTEYITGRVWELLSKKKKK